VRSERVGRKEARKLGKKQIVFRKWLVEEIMEPLSPKLRQFLDCDDDG
jgi:hypothetical protein